MSTDYYKFPVQLREGESGERDLVKYYSQQNKIFAVGRGAQRNGVDYYFEDRKNGYRYSVEVKSDYRAAESGNIFIETVSADTQDKKGWAYTCCAQLIYIYIPPLGLVYKIQALAIKFNIAAWIEKYDKAPPIKNNGYNTLGILIPIEDFEKYCYGVDDLNSFFAHSIP